MYILNEYFAEYLNSIQFVDKEFTDL